MPLSVKKSTDVFKEQSCHLIWEPRVKEKEIDQVNAQSDSDRELSNCDNERIIEIALFSSFWFCKEQKFISKKETLK